jgi:hypothetical protein
MRKQHAVLKSYWVGVFQSCFIALSVGFSIYQVSCFCLNYAINVISLRVVGFNVSKPLILF